MPHAASAADSSRTAPPYVLRNTRAIPLESEEPSSVRPHPCHWLRVRGWVRTRSSRCSGQAPRHLSGMPDEFRIWNEAGPLRNPGSARGRRDGRGLPREGRATRTRRRHQSAAGSAVGGSHCPRAPAPRGVGCSRARSSLHLQDLRNQRGRRPPVHRHGVRGRRDVAREARTRAAVRRQSQTTTRRRSNAGRWSAATQSARN